MTTGAGRRLGGDRHARRNRGRHDPWLLLGRCGEAAWVSRGAGERIEGEHGAGNNRSEQQRTDRRQSPAAPTRIRRARFGIAPEPLARRCGPARRGLPRRRSRGSEQRDRRRRIRRDGDLLQRRSVPLPEIAGVRGGSAGRLNRWRASFNRWAPRLSTERHGLRIDWHRLGMDWHEILERAEPIAGEGHDLRGARV
jgi:hypothetical protein